MRVPTPFVFWTCVEQGQTIYTMIEFADAASLRFTVRCHCMRVKHGACATVAYDGIVAVAGSATCGCIGRDRAAGCASATQRHELCASLAGHRRDD